MKNIDLGLEYCTNLSQISYGIVKTFLISKWLPGAEVTSKGSGQVPRQARGKLTEILSMTGIKNLKEDHLGPLLNSGSPSLIHTELCVWHQNQK